jgi:hypothetical protein
MFSSISRDLHVLSVAKYYPTTDKTCKSLEMDENMYNY